MLAYLTAHWRGDQNIAQSLFVNGALPYFALVTTVGIIVPLAALYMLTLLTYMMSFFALFFAWLVWWVVGTTRSAIRTLRIGGTATSKILAIVALALVVALLVKTASDVTMATLLFRGYAT